jgi:hypothetical protein
VCSPEIAFGPAPAWRAVGLIGHRHARNSTVSKSAGVGFEIIFSMMTDRDELF